MSQYGIRLKGNWDDVTFQFYLDGRYGVYLSDRIAALDRPFVFLDIGANQGLYSILAARNPNCRAVHAFEPVAATAALLRENARLNDVATIEVHEAAISARSGEIEIRVPVGHSGRASLRAGEVPGGATQRIRTVARAGLEAMIGDGGLQIFAKIDVEGHEAVVIAEIATCGFFSRISEMFYECDERWLDAKAMERRLGESGFTRIERIGGGAHYDVHARR